MFQFINIKILTEQATPQGINLNRCELYLCVAGYCFTLAFPMSQLFAWGGQSTGVSALASFLPKKCSHRKSQFPLNYWEPQRQSSVNVNARVQGMTKEAEKRSLSSAWKKVKSNRSVVSDFLRLHGLQPTTLLHPWNFQGKSTGVGRHCLLQGTASSSTLLTEHY